MLLANVPLRYTEFWAQNAGGAYVRAVPFPSQIGITPGAASFNDGFPPANFTPIGGVNPFGQDFNGILRAVTQWDQWLQAGGPIFYDATFSAAVGGYPQWAVVPSSNWLGAFWLNLVDSNTTNPDSGGSNWVGFSPLSLYTTDTGTANALVAALSPAPPSLARILGMPIRIKKGAAVNTGAVTLNLNGLGAQNIVTPDGNAVSTGVLFASGIMTLVWDGANFQLQSVSVSTGVTPAYVQQQPGNYQPDVGTANALVITLNPVPASLAILTGAPLRILKSNNTNTGTCTLAANGFTATAITWADGTVMSAGQLPGSCLFTCVYDGTAFRIQSQIRPAVTAQDLQLQAGNYGVDSGTANSMSITLSPVPANLAALTGVPIRVLKSAAKNTGATVLFVNGYSASVVHPDGSAMQAGELAASALMSFIYNGTSFVEQSINSGPPFASISAALSGASPFYPPLTSGYLVIPICNNGVTTQFYFQWSYSPEQSVGETVQTLSWPTAFPTTCMSAWVSTIYNSTSDVDVDGLFGLTGFTSSQYTIEVAGESGFLAVFGRAMTFGIGY